ncbi:MAG TPA: SGNH/GDSL hydrolase family protein [Lacipirellulaceae bacterium]|jgi:lysophospholipase L1-like esterase|nr:SGNH/GDSL hydrolase family protein [Lacipirellulaceae bacterium]
MSNLLTRTLLFAALLIACGLASLRHTIAAPTDAPAKPATGPRFESEIVAFEAYDHKNAAPQDPILFVGSSTVRLWQTADAFPGLPVINRGFGGSTIDDVNHYADRIVFKYKPRVIVFYSGDNDLAAGRSTDRVFNDFTTFVNSVHERLSNTSLIYLAIKPSIARWKIWPQMQEVNARVKELAQQNKQLMYIDTAPPLLGADGQPQKSLFRDDGLHMNDKGYVAWNKLLASKLH